jgi:hypothetical protein
MAVRPRISEELDEFLSGYPTQVRKLALRARAMLLERQPGLIERVWPGWKMIGYGTGPRMGDLVVGLGPAKAHLSVHLMRGTLLDDPEALLEGTSKTGRHIRIGTEAELERPAVQRLIDGAFALKADKAAGVKSTVAPAQGYQVGASKTIDVPIDALWRAWNDGRARRRWLPETFTVRKATEPKSMRITWNDDTDLQVLFYAKGDTKSQVTVDHRKLPEAQIEPMRAYWKERLAALKELVE